MSSWQLIFVQSKINNARYDGEGLVGQNWAWPKETWFQMRLRALRRSTRKDSEESIRRRLQ